jgi:CheY-like chemotaxis protein/anti-sigma regulatory factor (Ser/Thr protein kinase)
MKTFKILIVEDKKKDAERLDEVLKELLPQIADQGEQSVESWIVTDQADADLAVLETGPAGPAGFDLVFLDLRYPEMEGGPLNEDPSAEFQGMKWLPALRRAQPRAAIVILTSHAMSNSLRTAVQAIRDFQADDVVPKNLSVHDLVARITVACANRRRVEVMRRVHREFRSLIHSRFTRTYAEDLSRILDQSRAKFSDIARRLESGDPTAVDTAPDDIRKSFTALRDEFLQMTELLSEGEDDRNEVDIAEILRDFAVLYEDRFREAGALLVAPDVTLSLRCMTFSSDLKIALHEVILNSAEAFEQPSSRPRGERRCSMTALPTSAGVEIRIVDNGPGFQDAAIQQMFQLPKRKEGVRPGRGKGLYVAQRMMHSIGGSIRARNMEQGGVEVVLAVRDLRPRADPLVERVPKDPSNHAAPNESGQP